MKNGKLRVAVAGLRFGGGFVPIYCKHPDVYAVDIIEPDEESTAFYQTHLDINKVWRSLDDALGDGGIDAVHLVTPIPLHAEQSVKVLRSGKHCACTVPAATTLDDLHAIVAAERESGKNYMMMETAVYTRQFLRVQEMVVRGEFGRLQLLRGCHYQDMENWPPYWMGLPPMHYATHALGPLLRLAGCRAAKVHCFGSGTMREDLHKQYGNPFPAETAIFRLENHPAAMEITRTLFETARMYTEGFFVYGSKASIEWPFEDEPLKLQRMSPHPPDIRGSRIDVEDWETEDCASLLPPAIARFTEAGDYDDTNPQRNFIFGGGHHGSHPHLVHEFIRSIVENRPSAISAITAADWTAAGICAHISAMNDGKETLIPDFRKLEK